MVENALHERPHRWDPDQPAWQESVAAWFHDRFAGAGGFLRFGLHPTEGYGRSMVFAFDERAAIRFRRVRERVPVDGLDPEAPPTELAVGSCIVGLDDTGRVTVAWDEPESSAALAFEPFHDALGFTGDDDARLTGTIYGGHIECAGRFVGTLRLGEHELTIDALAHRDRSWGPRLMELVRTNRMMTGTFGPELSFAANTIQFHDGSRHDVGHIVRGGVHEPLTEMTILPSIHLDGYSVASGLLVARTAAGEQVRVTCETVAGQLTPYDGYLCSEHISVARCGELIGFCDNELTNNPRMGTEEPKHLQYVDGGDGLSTLPRQEI